MDAISVLAWGNQHFAELLTCFGVSMGWAARMFIGSKKASVDQLNLALKQIEDNTAQLNLLNGDYSEQRKKIDELTKLIHILTISNDELLGKIAGLQNDNKALSAKIQELELNNANLQLDNESLHSKISELEKDRDGYKDKLTALEYLKAENNILREENDKLTKENASFKKELLDLQNDQDKLLYRLSQLDPTVDLIKLDVKNNNL